MMSRGDAPIGQIREPRVATRENRNDADEGNFLLTKYKNCVI